MAKKRPSPEITPEVLLETNFERNPDELPYTAKELIEQLDEQVPHRCPDPGMSDREIWLYAGKRQLVDALLHKLRT